MKALKQLSLVMVLMAGTVAVWIAFVPSAAALLDRVGLLGVLGIEAPAATTDGADEFEGSDAASVLVAAVEERATADRVTAIGDGQARRIVTVRSETDGRVDAIGVASGERITEGAVIVRLDDRAERIALERAQIVRDDAQVNLDRLSQLADTGAVSSVQLQEAEFAQRTAALEVAQAEYDLDQRIIRAPISGWVGLIDLEIGQRIAAQDALATITDRSQILIAFRVPERVIPMLEVGQPVEVTPLAEGGTTLTGELSAIDTVVDRASRTLRVEGRLDNTADTLRSGMAFSVAMEFAGDTLPTIDPLALQWSREGSFVWVVRNGEAERVPVTIRERNPDAVLVEGALGAGDAVITEGHQTLRPGAAVTIVNRDDLTVLSRESNVAADSQRQ